MLRFDDVEQFLVALGPATRWRRVAEALRRADRVPPDVTLSIGDSLTYRVTASPDREALTGSRRYLAVRHVVGGSAVVEVAPVDGLEPAGPYSDLTDRQPFSGAATPVELRAGEVLVVEAGEAVRDVSVRGRVVVLRVTVEDGA